MALDAVGRDRLTIGDVVRILDAHRQAEQELRDRHHHEERRGVRRAAERDDSEEQPWHDRQAPADEDRAPGSDPLADGGRDDRAEEAADPAEGHRDAEGPGWHPQFSEREDGEQNGEQWDDEDGLEIIYETATS
ncbi:hypothetical protein [Microbacterium oleivorans]|uniref:hypothetical protein n=1 Tax=Microbacterium oleivorans TaxID=273677 RepID=UPI0020415669|nr:hypothetical protein [Microbacterium oleivorans]MCM3694887.1 hypothetical protein [Microbacterium oleivorans]